MPMPPGMFEQQTNLQCVELDVEAARLNVSMPGDERAVVELRRPGQSSEEQRVGRHIVYLDQNHWSTMAAARHGHRRVRPEEAQAARTLAELARSGQILLPVSAAHLVETTPLHGSPRVALAGTVLSLGRGWQMRNPLHVRAEEVLRAVKGADSHAVDVFAPGADGFFGSAQDGPSAASPRTVLAQLASTVPAVLGLYEAVIDEEAIPDEGGVAQAAAESWARRFGELAVKLKDAEEPIEMVRRVAYGNQLVDMMDDIVRVARDARISPETVIARLAADDDPVASMPFLGQMRQIIFARLRNVGQRWESNDLVDIMFLCCAAGYADLVVGERQAIGYLRQARRPAPRAKQATSLQEALRLLP